MDGFEALNIVTFSTAQQKTLPEYLIRNIEELARAVL